MAIPTYDQFIEPVLRFLATRPDGALAREVYEAAADAMQTKSGQSCYPARHSRFTKTG